MQHMHGLVITRLTATQVARMLRTGRCAWTPLSESPIHQRCRCVQRRMKHTQHCFQQSRIYRALHNSVERDCQHHEFQCECSSGVLQATPHIVGLIPSVPGHELTGCQVSKLIHSNGAPSIQTNYLKQRFSIVFECFVTQSVVHNLTEIHHRSGSRDRFRVQRIQLRDTCFRFLEEIIMVQLFCIICVTLLVAPTRSRLLKWGMKFITPSWLVALCLNTRVQVTTLTLLCCAVENNRIISVTHRRYVLHPWK